MTLNRRELLTGGGALAASTTLAAPALAQTAKTLKFIPVSDLIGIDPIWTTSTAVGNHGYLVYDTLFGMDAEFVTVQRRLLEKLGINRLLAVVGPSYGGMQAFSWATEFPDFMKGTVAVVMSLGPPPAPYSSGSHQCCELIPTGTAAITMRLWVWSTRLPT